MPANRSRTERWRESLWKIYERGGGLEFTIDRAASPDARDLVWRVRVLGVSEREILVEYPGALGRSFRVDPGAALVGIMTVGQNRWMFHTEVVGVDEQGPRGVGRSLRLRMPTDVERCLRRSFGRISTAELNLPKVDCWPLLDARSAEAPEVASRVRLLDALDAGIVGAGAARDRSGELLPEVGPGFGASLANIGGGGVGLCVARDEAGPLETSYAFWMRIDLGPVLPAPLCLTGRLVHTHLNSQQEVYAGMAFDFSHHPAHGSFVLEQIDRYLTRLQTARAA